MFERLQELQNRLASKRHVGERRMQYQELGLFATTACGAPSRQVIMRLILIHI